MRATFKQEVATFCNVFEICGIKLCRVRHSSENTTDESGEDTLDRVHGTKNEDRQRLSGGRLKTFYNRESADSIRSDMEAKNRELEKAVAQIEDFERNKSDLERKLKLYSAVRKSRSEGTLKDTII